MADGKVRVDVVVKSLSELNKIQRQLGNNIGKVKLLSTGIGSLGNQLGFVAFQFTFMAGIAGRALQSIQQNLQRVIEGAAEAEDQVVRAIAQSGLDIGAKRSAAAIQFLNDSIRDLGSGKTIFNTKEVAEASKEIGRAFTFTGTEMQKAASIALVTQASLRLMSIEGIDAEKAAIQLAKVMKQFGIAASDAAEVVGILVEVNQSSAATLDQLTASMAAGGNIAREFGVTIKELAAITGVLADRIGIKNSAAGRAFRVILENLMRTQVRLNPQFKQFGIHLTDNAGNMNNIIDILGEFENALNKGGKAGSFARQQILEMGAQSIRAKDALLALTQGGSDLRDVLRRLDDAEVIGEQFEQIFSETTEGKIKRIKAAVNSLQIDFVSGLSPALTVIISQINDIVRTDEIQTFFKSLGKTIAEDVVPVLTRLGKIFRFFVSILKSNDFLVSALSKSLLVLVGVLSTLFIVGTVGALLAAMGAGLQRLIGFLGITTASTILLVRAMLPLFAASLGVFLALKAVDNIIGIVKDGFQEGEEAALALNSALLILGGGITLLSLRMATAGIGVAVAALAPASLIAAIGSTAALGQFGNVTGRSFGRNFASGMNIQVADGLGKVLTKLRGLGSAGIIGIVAVAGLAIGVALRLGLEQSIKDAKDFGFSSAGELILNDWAFTLADMSIGMQQFVIDVRNNWAEVVGFAEQAFESMMNNDWESLGKQIDKAFEPIQQSISDIIDGFGVLGLALDDPLVFKKTQGIKNIRKALEKEFAENNPLRGLFEAGAVGGLQPKIIMQLPGVARAIEQAGESVNLGELNTLIEEFIGNVPELNEEVLNARDMFLLSNGALADQFTTLKDYQEIIGSSKELFEEQDEVLEEAILTSGNFNKGVLDAIKKHKLNTTGIGNVTNSLNLENDIIGEETEALILNTQGLDIGTKALDEDTIQLIKSQNRLVDFNIQVDKANVAFSLLAREGSEAARRLATLRVTKKGKFKIEGRQTAGVSSSEVAELGSDISRLQNVLDEDLVELTKIDKLMLEEAQRATEIFASAGIQSGDKGFTTTEEAMEAARKVGTTSSIQGLSDLIASGLMSGLSSTTLFPLVTQLIDLMAQQAAGVNRSGVSDTFTAEEGRQFLVELADSIGVGDTINTVTINVDGIADETTGEDMANAFLDTLSIEGQNKLRR